MERKRITAWLSLIFVFPALALPVPSRALCKSGEDCPVYDLIPDLDAQGTLRVVPHKPGFTAEYLGNGCDVNYAGTPVINKLPTLVTGFPNNRWSLAEWNNLDTLCDGRVFRDGATNVLTIAPANQAPSRELRWDAGTVRMALRSEEHYRRLFGRLFYRGDMAVPWATFFLSHTNVKTRDVGNRVFPLTAYGSLDMVFDGALQTRSITTSRLPGDPPARATHTYSAIHRSQFGWFQSISYREPYCEDPVNSAAHFCNGSVAPPSRTINFHNRYFHFGIRLHDEQLPFYPHRSIQFDPGTGETIYKADWRKIDPNFANQEVNPFFMVGNRTLIRADMLPHYREAALFLLANNKSNEVLDLAEYNANPTPFLDQVELDAPRKPGETDAEFLHRVFLVPPRQWVPAAGAAPRHVETDEEYLSHFVLGGTHLNYEVGGISSLAFDIFQFRMTGKMK